MIRFGRIFLILLVSLDYFYVYCDDGIDDIGKCRVSTRSHDYIGFKSTTYDHQDVYCSFLGIKYGVAQRFKEGVEYTGSTEDTGRQVEAVQDQSECLQLKGNTTAGHEDCLFLSVHSPDLNGSLPVLVYIHGGGFAIGSSKLSYQNPDYFMKTKRVVMVAIQYRLGVLGFIDFNSDEFPSNLGMKDQVLALKWIRQNIGSFGGDADRVTLEGVSAGAASVSLHMFSPLSKGLFHRGISESGSACATWSVLPKVWARERLRYLAALVGCPVSDIPTNILEPADLTARCLLSKTGEELVEATRPFSVVNGMNTFLPVVEKASYKNTFLTYIPWSNKVNQVPWISGINSNEAGLLIYAFGSRVDDDKEFKLNLSLSKVLYYDHTTLDPHDISQEIESYYNFSSPIDMPRVPAATKTLNNGLFSYPNYLCHKVHSGSSSYNYFFDYVASYQRNRLAKGVYHTEEAKYLYIRKGKEIIRLNGTSQDIEVSDRMVDLWVQFVETGTPSLPDVTWAPYNSSTNNVLIINDSGFNMGKDPDLQDNMFWDMLSFRDLM